MTFNKKIRILIVDDRDIIRDTFKLMFSNDKNIIITGEAEDGIEAMNCVKSNNYDVIVMDINMPYKDGFETTKALKIYDPSTKILAHTFHVNPFYVSKMIECGASGYIIKGDSFENYKDAIWTVYNGGVYLSDNIEDDFYQKVFRTLKYPSPINTIV